MKEKTIGTLSKITAVIALAVLGATTPARSAEAEPTGPTLIKSLVSVRANRLVRLWKSPTVSVGDTWTWLPEVSFFVVGPVPTGSQFSIDFTKPDGSPWYSVECPTAKVEPLAWRAFGTPGIPGHVDKRATQAVGTYGFRICYENSLNNAKQVLMNGTFQVSKFHKGNALPAFKNQFEYVVSQDWRLPIGSLWPNGSNDAKVPWLTASMWFRGDLDSTTVAGYLFYKGKQVASTKVDGNAYNSFSLLTTGSDETDPRWELWDFHFSSVRCYNLDPESGNNWSNFFFLSKNPGEYEIKVLRDGTLARTAKFTVGEDGAIIDNGIARQNKLGGIATVLPTKILGTGDGKYDATAWKTGAYYGNPLTGFTAP